MKICPECGAKNFDSAKVCERCKADLKYGLPDKVQPDFSGFFKENNIEHSNAVTSISAYPNMRKIPTCAKAAKILMIITSFLSVLLCVLGVIYIVLSAGIPANARLLLVDFLFSALLCAFANVPVLMTYHYSAALSKGGDVGIGFKICTLIFISQLAGIFMILDNGD